jgi:hypothetical protein
MLRLGDALAPLTSLEVHQDMHILRPPSFLRWYAGALVRYLHHHHPYREPRTHVPAPTHVIRP